MPRPINWPSVAADEADAPPSPVAAIADTAGLAAAFGPELTRLFGARCAARLVAEPASGTAPAVSHTALSHVVAQLRLPVAAAGTPPSTLTLLLAPDGIASLLDILFGGSAATAGGPLPALPPASASWMALSRFLADACARALAATGQRFQGPAEIPPRPAPATGIGAPQIRLRLDIDGAETLLGLRLEGAEIAAPTPPPADPDLWRQRASARILDLALPVALRLSETRIPVGRIATLSRGDILPLDRPSTVELRANGRLLKMLPASHLAPNPTPNDTSNDTHEEDQP